MTDKGQRRVAVPMSTSFSRALQTIWESERSDTLTNRSMSVTAMLRQKKPLDSRQIGG
jgi:hypothetical protein